MNALYKKDVLLFEIIIKVVGVAAIACGLIAISTCNSEVTSVILQTMMERSAIELKEHHAKNLALGLGLTYLGNDNIYKGS